MNGAREACVALVGYEKAGAGYRNAIAKAKRVVADAEKSGELELDLKPGELVDTGMTFRGHGVLILIKATGRDHQKRSRLAKQFWHVMDKYMRTTHPSPYGNPEQSDLFPGLERY